MAEISVPGVTATELLDSFRKYSNAPNATAEDMYAALNSQQERERISVPLTAGRGRWTFARPFPDGVIPVVSVQAETPVSTDYVLEAQILEGTTTNTKTDFIVNRFNASQTLGTTLTAIAGTVIQMFRPAHDVGSITVNCFAEAKV